MKVKYELYPMGTGDRMPKVEVENQKKRFEELKESFDPENLKMLIKEFQDDEDFKGDPFYSATARYLECYGVHYAMYHPDHLDYRLSYQDMVYKMFFDQVFTSR